MSRGISLDEFEQLYRDTATELFAYVRRRTAIDPENVVAETYAIAWRRRADLPSSLLRRAWLFGTARTLLLAEARVRAREADVAEQAGRLGEQSCPPEGQRAEVVAGALSRLRPDEREIIQLVEWERATPAEVAIVLGIRPGTARVRLHRARQSLAADPEMQRLVEEAQPTVT